MPPPAVAYFEPALTGAAATRTLNVTQSTKPHEIKSFVEGGGGTISFPAGTFTYPASTWTRIHFNHDVFIKGAGKGKTFIESDWDRSEIMNADKVAVFGDRAEDRILLVRDCTFRGWRAFCAGFMNVWMPDNPICSSGAQVASVQRQPFHLYNVRLENVGRLYGHRVRALDNVRMWHVDGVKMLHFFSRENSDAAIAANEIEGMKGLFVYDTYIEDLFYPDVGDENAFRFREIGFKTGNNIQDKAVAAWAKDIQYQNVTVNGATTTKNQPHATLALELFSFQGTVDDTSWMRNIVVFNLGDNPTQSMPATAQTQEAVVYSKGSFVMENVYVKDFYGCGQGVFTNKGGGGVKSQSVANGMGYPVASAKNIAVINGRRSPNWATQPGDANYNERGLHGVFGFRNFFNVTLDNIWLEDLSFSDGAGNNAGFFFPDGGFHDDDVVVRNVTMKDCAVTGAPISLQGQSTTEAVNWTFDNIRVEGLVTQDTKAVAIGDHGQAKNKGLSVTRVYLEPASPMSDGYLIWSDDANTTITLHGMVTGRMSGITNKHRRGGSNLSTAPLDTAVDAAEVPGANLDWVPPELDARGGNTTSWIGAWPDRAWKD